MEDQYSTPSRVSRADPPASKKSRNSPQSLTPVAPRPPTRHHRKAAPRLHRHRRPSWRSIPSPPPLFPSASAARDPPGPGQTSCTAWLLWLLFVRAGRGVARQRCFAHRAAGLALPAALAEGDTEDGRHDFSAREGAVGRYDGVLLPSICFLRGRLRQWRLCCCHWGLGGSTCRSYQNRGEVRKRQRDVTRRLF